MKRKTAPKKNVGKIFSRRDLVSLGLQKRRGEEIIAVPGGDVKIWKAIATSRAEEILRQRGELPSDQKLLLATPPEVNRLVKAKKEFTQLADELPISFDGKRQTYRLILFPEGQLFPEGGFSPRAGRSQTLNGRRHKFSYKLPVSLDATIKSLLDDSETTASGHIRLILLGVDRLLASPKKYGSIYFNWDDYADDHEPLKSYAIRLSNAELDAIESVRLHQEASQALIRRCLLVAIEDSKKPVKQ